MLNSHDTAYGIGGIARLGQGELPADWVMGEHVRLGCGHLILSRAFRGGADDIETMKASIDLAGELKMLRAVERQWRNASDSDLMANQQRLSEKVFSLARHARIAQ